MPSHETPSHEKGPNGSFSFHPNFIVKQGENQSILGGHVHGHKGMSLDEVRHRTADHTGVDPANVAAINPLTGEVSAAPKSRNSQSRSWGFSKWGAKWEPTGPKGNPNLN